MVDVDWCMASTHDQVSDLPKFTEHSFGERLLEHRFVRNAQRPSGAEILCALDLTLTLAALLATSNTPTKLLNWTGDPLRVVLRVSECCLTAVTNSSPSLSLPLSLCSNTALTVW